MKRLLVLPFVLLLAWPLLAQQPTVVFDPMEGSFSDQAKLPAETPFTLQGDLPAGVDRVRVDISDGGKGLGELLFSQSGQRSEWARPEGANPGFFRLRVAHALRGDRNHDVVLTFFRAATAAERQDFKQRLESTLSDYLRLNLETGKKLRWTGNARQIQVDCEAIVNNATADVAYKREIPFDGFSDLVRQTLEKGIEEGSTEEDAQALRKTILSTMQRELDHLYGSNLQVVHSQYVLRQYPTEHTRTEIGLQVGYAGTWFKGGFNALDYDAAPFAGLSFPFGNAALRSAFWSNTAFDVGVMLTNLEDADGRSISGPIVGRPIYAGLSYRIIRFVRFNAGAAILETGGGDGIFDVGSVEVRPYLGLSASFKFWMNFDN